MWKRVAGERDGCSWCSTGGFMVSLVWRERRLKSTEAEQHVTLLRLEPRQGHCVRNPTPAPAYKSWLTIHWGNISETSFMLQPLLIYLWWQIYTFTSSAIYWAKEVPATHRETCASASSIAHYRPVVNIQTSFFNTRDNRDLNSCTLSALEVQVMIWE